jgi:hypothetical protein
MMIDSNTHALMIIRDVKIPENVPVVEALSALKEFSTKYCLELQVLSNDILIEIEAMDLGYWIVRGSRNDIMAFKERILPPFKCYENNYILSTLKA